MSITTVLFDLDGTLVPMNQDIFIKDYFQRISQYLAQYGYDPKKIIDMIWHGTYCMINNDDYKSNEQIFWEYAISVYGEKIRNDISLFDNFYKQEFDKVKQVCGYNPRAAEVVRNLKTSGYRVALATNPIFPAVATRFRIGWAGLRPDDFELYTTYENINYSKPNLEYYHKVAQTLGVSPEECLMVGNDVSDDMVAKKIGMKVFLVTDCLINKEERNISDYPNGDFNDLMRYIESI